MLIMTKLLNWVAKKSKWAEDVRGALYDAERAARKLEQGYREHYVAPRHEFDRLISIREKLKNLRFK